MNHIGEDVDAVCFFGKQMGSELIHWLESHSKRILIWAHQEHNHGVLSHPRIRSFSVGPFWELQLETFVQEFVFLHVELLCEEKGAQSDRFFEVFCLRLTEAELRYSDAKRFGVQILQNALHNCAKLPQSAFGPALKESCAGIPAIVCGASPSLEEIRELNERALWIACGSSAMAFCKMGITPHAYACLDPDPPLVRFCGELLEEVPLFYQMRFAHTLLNSTASPLIWMPENGNWPFERYLREECGLHTESFDAGWTSGTFGAAIAVHLGCNPIILAGMDFCVFDTTYACDLPDEEHRGEFIPYDGKKSKRDWVMSVHWLANFIESTPHVKWMHLTKQGLYIPGATRVGIENIRIPKAQRRPSLHAVREKACASMPDVKLCNHVQERFTSSFLYARKLVREWFQIRKDSHNQRICKSLLLELEGESCYVFYLAPLWKLWRVPLLRVEGEEEMHKMVLFARVLEEWYEKSCRTTTLLS